MKKIYNRIVMILLAVMIPITILIGVLQYYTFNETFYMKAFEKYEITSVTGMTEDQLLLVTEKLTGYLENSQDNLIIRASVNGVEEQIFQEREIKHMVDVKAIFMQINRLKYFLVMFLLLIFISQITQKEVLNIDKGFIGASVLFSVVLLVLSFMILTDFSKYFIQFHEIFFTNDLWLLNPRTDILIQMLPLEFFIDIAVRIIATTGVAVYGMTGVIHVLLRRQYD